MHRCLVTGGFFAPLFFALALYPSSVFAQLGFQKSVIDSRQAGAYCVMSVDMDRDGRNDVLACGGNGLYWYRNNGGSFSKRTIGTFSGAWWLYAADVDRDGDYDVLGGSPKLNQVKFFQNKGGGSFDSYVVGDGVNAETVFAADLDGDGDLDVLASDWQNNKIHWWKYNGGHSFSHNILDNNLSGAHSVTAGDYDRDGDTDVVASGSGKINLYKNNGGGRFSSATTFGSGGSLCVQTIDFNKDGRPDILCSGRQSGDIAWYESRGSSFSKHTVATKFGDCWSVHAGDMDKDGDLDVVAAAISNNYVKAWTNNGNNTSFKEYLVDGNINSARGAWAADLDKDGDADLLSVARKSNQVAWYKVGSSSSARFLADGETADSDTIAVENDVLSPPQAGTFALHQNYPNPFNPETRIEYELAEPVPVRLTIYDVLGREVISLANAEQAAGVHRVMWNGVDTNGIRVSSGMYFCKLQAGSFIALKRMMLVQ